MKQFTVYAGGGKGEGFGAVYMVHFIPSGVIAYPLRKGWDEDCERIEKGINRTLYGAPGNDPVPKIHKNN